MKSLFVPIGRLLNTLSSDSSLAIPRTSPCVRHWRQSFRALALFPARTAFTGMSWQERGLREGSRRDCFACRHCLIAKRRERPPVYAQIIPREYWRLAFCWAILTALEGCPCLLFLLLFRLLLAWFALVRLWPLLILRPGMLFFHTPARFVPWTLQIFRQVFPVWWADLRLFLTCFSLSP